MSYIDILNQYAGLLIAQYKVKPKAQATVKLLVNSNVCEGLPLELQNCFDLSTAYGNKLTILGKIVGVPRNVIGLDLGHSFFSFTDYIGVPASVGFGDYANTPPDSNLLLDYNDSFIYTMTDFELRTAIQLAIIYNTGALTFKNIKNKLYNFFHGDIDITLAPDFSDSYFNFTDYNGLPTSNGFGNYATVPYDSFKFADYSNYEIMSINYLVKTIHTNAFTVAQFLGIVPAPMAVDVNVTYN
jgi:hypothetical protein